MAKETCPWSNSGEGPARLLLLHRNFLSFPLPTAFTSCHVVVHGSPRTE